MNQHNRRKQTESGNKLFCCLHGGFHFWRTNSDSVLLQDIFFSIFFCSNIFLPPFPLFPPTLPFFLVLLFFLSTILLFFLTMHSLLFLVLSSFLSLSRCLLILKRRQF